LFSQKHFTIWRHLLKFGCGYAALGSSWLIAAVNSLEIRASAPNSRLNHYFFGKEFMRKLLLAAALMALVGISHLRAEEPAAGKQVERELKVGDRSIHYLFYLPKGYDSNSGKLPLMLFLHGRGESQPPLSTVKKWGPPKMVDTGTDFPYILVSPQCPMTENWSQPAQQKLLVALLDEITAKFKVDTDRVYLTGLSMGGFGSWTLAADHPERFAAIAPICGGGKPEDAAKLKDLPIWVWHGTDDNAVPVKRSIDMVEAIKKAGGDKIRFTTLEHVGHVSWEAAYHSPDFYAWLDKQKRNASK
jgi:predicted peptidase